MGPGARRIVPAFHGRTRRVQGEWNVQKSVSSGGMRQVATALGALLLAACAAQAPQPQAAAAPAPAPVVNAQKFSGQWYLIAHVPTESESDQLDSSIELRPRLDGGYDEVYHYFDGKLMQGLAVPRSRYTVVAGSNNTQWISRARALDKTLTLGVLYVDPDYRYAVVGEAGRQLGWIYARDPAVDAATYRLLVAQLDQRGYDVARLHRLGHSQVLVGKTQFATP